MPLIRYWLFSIAAAPFFLAAVPSIAQQPIELRVDLRDVPRHLAHVAETLPAQAGENTLLYPKWLQGEHLPGGPIENVTGTVFRADGPDGPVLHWRRDLVNMYAFHVDAPAGTKNIYAAFDILETPSHEDPSSWTTDYSSHVALLEFTQVVLYPANVAVINVPVRAQVLLPDGWSAATPLRTGADDTGALHPSGTTFAVVSLQKLGDSPLLAGDHCKQIPLAPEITPHHTLDVCTEKAEDLNVPQQFLDGMTGTVRQAHALFGHHHYEHYDFLVAVSQFIKGDSVEHTESAKYVVDSLDMSNPATARSLAYLMPHEYVHAWCGKYRRPIGLATPDYQVPFKDDLLWVYEGLTEYWGDVLAARSGMRNYSQSLSAFTFEAWIADVPGRTWRPLQDTADASAILRGDDPNWANWRRGQDYYPEGALTWLEADVKIRQLTNGKKSLDDFAASFFGGPKNTPPGVDAYTFDDVVVGLNAVAPYDWRGFWLARLNAIGPKLPTGGFEGAGYNYVVTAKMDPAEAFMDRMHLVDAYRSLGFFVLPDGTLQDVWVNSPAYAAGFGPGDKLTKVDGAPYSSDALRKAIQSTASAKATIALTAERNGEAQDRSIPYQGGEKFVSLERNSQPELFQDILNAR